jgi:hypothetical protein
MRFELEPNDTLVMDLDSTADDAVVAFVGEFGGLQIRLPFSPRDAAAVMRVLAPLAARYGGPVR